jgi:hypothetical protein
LALDMLIEKTPRTMDASQWQKWQVRRVSEEAFMSHVITAARFFRWQLVYHTRDSRKSAPGFPDLVLCRPPRVLWLELKSEIGMVSDTQQEWIDGLLASGQEVYVFKPSQWDAVLEVLR